MDTVIAEIRAIQRRARVDGDLSRPAWPVIVLKTPKGWTGPRQLTTDKRLSCRAYTREQGEDAPEITDWKRPY
jgi:phosphoketolase